MAILQSGYTDASRTNASSRSTRLYRDIALSFERNAATKDVIVKKDVDAVKQSIKSLILTDKMERPFQPTIGCDIRKSLFENFTPQTIMVAKQRIGETIEQYEPRCNIIDIKASPSPDNNSLEISLIFSVINTDEAEELSLVLERVR